MANGLFNLKQVVQAVQQGGWPAQRTPAVEYLVVAGGGGGGGVPGSQNYAGGGGGAGGLLVGIDPVPNGQTLLVTVGGGGSGGVSAVGTNGGVSVFSTITATGGGGGGGGSTTGSGAGVSGGSGGGGSGSTAAGFGGLGTSGQGNNGGRGADAANSISGGGGGAGTVGMAFVVSAAPCSGGAGIASAISGTVTAYAGGGGGSAENTVAGTGGVGGGGNGNASANGSAGTANTGGGGGGGARAYNGGAGGSGVVIVSYPDVYAAATATTGSPTVSTSGSGSIAGTTATHFYYAGQSAFVFGAGDFTIECWVYFNNFTTYPTIVDFRDSSNAGNGISLYAYNTGVLTLYANGADRISGATLSTSQWYHIAVTRSGTSTKMFLNGTQTGSTYSDGNSYTCGAASPVFMANGAKSSGAVNGSVSNIRIVKGTALYTTTFTPSTTPLTVVSGTSVLLNAVSGAFMADGSTNSFVATVSAQVPTWSALSPFTGTGYKNRVYTWTSSGSITF
jgi:hypothetical protein